MTNRIAQVTTSFALAATLFATTLPVSAQTTQQPTPQQTTTPPQTGGTPPTVPTSTSSKVLQQGDKKQSLPRVVPTGGSTGKNLATNEDPRQIGTRKINNGTVFTSGGSLEKEVRLGQQLAAEINKTAKFVDDEVVTEYVNRVGQNIVLHSDSKIPFTIKVVDDDSVNAFALPGGFFYVNKGLVLAADNEAEVAGVMAHEIAHVAARHAVENQRKGLWTEIGLTAAAVLLGGGIGGAILQNTAGLGTALLFTKFSRGAEEEADRLGIQYMWAAGYDPNAMSTMFEKLQAQNKKKPGFFARTFSTHPQTPERIATTRALVVRFPERDEYVLTTSEFQRVKSRLLRLSNSRYVGGELAGGDGAPGRPTLKRRRAETESSTETSKPQDNDKKDKDGAPTLRRKTGGQ